MLIEENFPVYLLSQINRVFSAPLGALIEHLETFHYKNVFSGQSDNCNDLNKVWNLSFQKSKTAFEIFGQIYEGVKLFENIEHGYIWSIIFKNSNFFLNELSRPIVVRLGSPSLKIKEKFYFCDDIRSGIQKFLENLIYNKYEIIPFDQNCLCQDIPENYVIAENNLSSFFMFLNTSDTPGSLTSLIVALSAEKIEFAKLKNLIFLLHNILPADYTMYRF